MGKFALHKLIVYTNSIMTIIKDPCIKCSGTVVFEDTLFEGKEMMCTKCGYSQIPPREDPDLEIPCFGGTKRGRRRMNIQQGNYSYMNYVKGLL